jgi:hypothetical protein
MPLHDWTDCIGWEGMHLYWLTELARLLRTRLPAGYRAVIGASPLVAIGGAVSKPDVAVTPPAPPVSTAPMTNWEPDVEVPVATLVEEHSVWVEQAGRLIAAIELISPRNKDRPTAREQYAARYVSYLRSGVHLALVDVHRRPLGFAFGQTIAATFNTPLPTAPAPVALAYRVGTAAAQGGRMLGVWQRLLTVGQPLPALVVPLSLTVAVEFDLDSTYHRAANDNYVESDAAFARKIFLAGARPISAARPLM